MANEKESVSTPAQSARQEARRHAQELCREKSGIAANGPLCPIIDSPQPQENYAKTIPST
jgi:hypothetical protein